jgi:O-antigen/teichoic acid export membrane protein
LEKALEMGKTSATGSFQLLVGVATSTIIMAIGTIILTRLLGNGNYGLYLLAMAPSVTLGLFRDWGVNSAMTKYVASLRGESNELETCDVVAAGVTFEVATGIALSILSFVLAGFFASTLKRPEIYPFISIMSLTILSGSLLAAAQSSFIGYERMNLNSFTVICQAIVKTAVGPVLVLLGYGILGATLGFTLSFIAAGLIGVGTLYLVLYRPLSKRRKAKHSIIETLKPMLKYGVPLNISGILLGLLGQLYTLMMGIYIPNTATGNGLIGNYGVAVNFSVLLTFFTIPIGTVLFPAFAKLDSQNEHELLKTVFASSVKYTAILLIPATMAVMALSTPMVNTLFGEAYAYAPFFLTLNVSGYLFVAVGNLSLGSFLTGLGETKVLMKQAVLTMLIGLPLAFLLIPPFGILGIIIGGTMAGIPSMTWGLYWVWKHHQAKAELRSSAKIFTASALAAIASFLTTTLLHTTAWIQLALGLSVFLLIYVLGAPLIGAICQSDIDALRTMFSSLGIVSKIINIPLKAAEKAAQTKARHKTPEESEQREA